MSPARLYVVHLLFSLLPATRCFAFKRSLLRWAGATVGERVRVVSSARFFLTGKLTIGDETWIGHDVLVVGGEAHVRIGERVDVAPRVCIVGGTHEMFTEPDRAGGRGSSLPISIGDGAWICAGATILGGVSVGECSIVAAGAVVNRDVAPRVTVGGVPARAIPTHRGEGPNDA